MPRYKLIIEYDGTDYCGWQRQDNAKTVQEEIEKALNEFGEGNISVTGAGRTDSGVHALGQVAHFDLRREIEPEELKSALNAKIPSDIVIKHLENAQPEFHARYDAVRRKYLYVISKYPTAIGHRFSWFPPYIYKFDLLCSLASDILGEHDFAGFCKLKSRKENTKCTVFLSNWYENDAQVIFEIQADRFLHSMVRLIAGTMLDIARGRFKTDTIIEILESRDVNQAGTALPAQGLFLAEVIY